jgi:tape measure domain-containing protein
MASTGIAIGIDPRAAQTGGAAVNRAILEIRNNVVGLRGDIDRLARSTREDFTSMSRDARQSSDAMATSLQRNTAGVNSVVTGYRALRAAIPLALIAATTRELVQQADAYTNMTSKLRLTTDNEVQLAQAQQRVFGIAQDTRTGLGATIDLYTRMARSTRDFGLSQERVAAVTTTVNQAIQVGGSTSTEAANGVIQLGQALASGALRGDELRSILEQMPRLSQALAEGIGVSVGELRKLGEAGALSTARIINALETQAPKIASEYAKMTPTIASSFTQLGNSVTQLIGKLNELTGTGPAIASWVSGIAKEMSDPENTRTMKLFAENLARAKQSWTGSSILSVGKALWDTDQQQAGQRMRDREDLVRYGRDPSLIPEVNPSVRRQLEPDPFDLEAIRRRRMKAVPRTTLDELRQLEELEQEENFQDYLERMGNSTPAQRRAGQGRSIAPRIDASGTTRARYGTPAAGEAFGADISKQVEESIRESEVGIDGLEEYARNSARNMQNEYGAFFDYSKQVFEDMRNVGGTFFVEFSEGLAHMVASGKLDFKGFAQSIIQELIRIQVRALIVRALMTFFGGSTGAATAGATSGVGALTGATAGYAAKGTNHTGDRNMIVGEEGMETLNMRNNVGARIMNNRDTQKLLQGLQSQSAPPAPESSGDTYVIKVEQSNVIHTTGVTADEVQAKVAQGMQQAVSAAVSKVQHKYAQNRL